MLSKNDPSITLGDGERVLIDAGGGLEMKCFLIYFTFQYLWPRDGASGIGGGGLERLQLETLLC